MNEIIFHKTRIAPTPSGFLHLGNAYSFLLTQAIAEKANAKILLRIDDLDAQRMRPEYVQDIFDTLDFIEIKYDEGPKNVQEYENQFSQIKRLSLYNDALEKLREINKVYACSCSRTQLETNPCECRNKNISLDQTETAWRLITDDEDISIKVFNGDPINTGLPEAMKDFIVRKKDGMPAYQLSSLVDDVHFDVDLIVRGEDLWESTLAQLYLAQILGADQFLNTVFLHHPLLPNAEGNKLSKSAGALSVQYFRKEGYISADIYRKLGEMIGAEMPVSSALQLKEVLLSRF